jgi:hypothetical protein
MGDNPPPRRECERAGERGGLAINVREGSMPLLCTSSTLYPPDEQLLMAVGGVRRGDNPAREGAAMAVVT